MYQITQLSSTCRSVITLGHSVKQPLIQPPSELFDGLEPHDQFYLSGMPVRQLLGTGVRWEGVPGVRGWGGYREGLYRVLPSLQISGLFDELYTIFEI